MNAYRWFGRSWLSLGYLFLYIPIIMLIVFSFNNSRQDMVWTGFTFRWYAALTEDAEIIAGFMLSLKIKVCASRLNILFDNGNLQSLSMTILIGFVPEKFLTVSVGLSTSAVVVPINIALSSLRH